MVFFICHHKWCLSSRILLSQSLLLQNLMKALPTWKGGLSFPPASAVKGMKLVLVVCVCVRQLVSTLAAEPFDIMMP